MNIITKKTLGDYVSVQGGYAFKSKNFVDDGMPIVRISDLTMDDMDIEKCAKYPLDSGVDFEKYRVSEGDILIAMSGATTGKIGVVKGTDCEMVLNQRVGNFKIKDESQLDKTFLFYLVRSEYYQKEVGRLSAGCAQPNISAKKLENIPIHIPSLDIQRKNTKTLSNIDEMITYKNQSIDLLDNYLNSQFSKLFGKLWEDTHDWGYVTLNECSLNKGDFVDGPFGSNLKSSDFTNEGARLIQVNNVGVGHFNNTNKRYTSMNKYNSLLKHEAKTGDIIIAKMGNPLGRACILPDYINEALIVADCMRLRVTNPLFNKYYLMFYLNSPYVKAQLNLFSQGSTRVRINLSKIKKIEVLKPPIELQNKFESIFKKVEHIIVFYEMFTPKNFITQFSKYEILSTFS